MHHGDDDDGVKAQATTSHGGGPLVSQNNETGTASTEATAEHDSDRAVGHVAAAAEYMQDGANDNEGGPPKKRRIYQRSDDAQLSAEIVNPSKIVAAPVLVSPVAVTSVVAPGILLAANDALTPSMTTAAVSSVPVQLGASLVDASQQVPQADGPPQHTPQPTQAPQALQPLAQNQYPEHVD